MFKKLISTLIFTSLATATMAQELITENGKVYKLYTVEKSEGLYRISLNNNVSQEEIIAINPEIQQTGLVEGMTIKIPVKNAESSEIGYSIYIVGKGETAYSISKKFDMQLIDLYKLNPGIESGVTEGQKLKVKGSANEARSYNIHTIAAGETLYSIGVKYGVKAQQIIDANPALDPTSLKVGSQLRIPDTQIPIEDNNFFYHRIESGETLYALCNKYNLLQDKIIAANDGINWQALQVGQVIAIPKANAKTSEFIKHEVKKRETLYSISKQYKVSIADIEKANPDIDLSNLKKDQIIQIPVAIKEEFVGPATINPEFVGIEGELIDNQTIYNYKREGRPAINVAVMLPFDARAELKSKRETPLAEDQVYNIKTRPYIEFFEGVRMAADSLKEAGANVILHVFDTYSNWALVNSLNNLDDNLKFDLIIGPSHSATMKTMADFAFRNKIPTVLPFAQSDSTIFENPYIFQASVIDTITNRAIIEKMLDQCVDKHVIILNPTQDKTDLWRLNLIQTLCKKRKINYALHSYSTKAKEKFLDLLSLTQENVILFPTNKEAVINSTIVSISGALDKKKDAIVTLFGVGDWLTFATIEVDVFHRLNTKLFSTFALDYKNPQINWLLNKYRKAYYAEPVAFTPYFQKTKPNSGFSEYALWGYDIAIKFIGARLEYGRGFERHINDYKPQLIQSNFDFKHLTNWGGAVNVGLKTITFTPDNNIIVENLNDNNIEQQVEK